jgi:hypothetical protein
MPKITTIATAGKPRPDFPLFVHQAVIINHVISE